MTEETQSVQSSLHFSVPKAVAPRPVPDGVNLDHPSLYFNNELSWIDFNWRVLYQALDARLPLLERVRFIAITVNNLDEFVQKRVGGLKRQQAAAVSKLSPDGRTPAEQLALIRQALEVMLETATRTWEQDLKPQLPEQLNIRIFDYADLSAARHDELHDYFQTHISPVLTPLAVDTSRPFPFISNLSLSLGVIVRHPSYRTAHFARVKVPSNVKRWVQIKDGDRLLGLLPVEQLIAHHIGELFHGMEIQSVHPFRITRSANVKRDEEEAEDLIAMISEELRERRFAEAVRLEITPAMPDDMRRILIQELGLTHSLDSVYQLDGLLDLTCCFGVASLPFPDHQFEPWEPRTPPRLMLSEETPDIFSVIRQGDVLVHHPYESFQASVQRLIEAAAEDPQVLAIKQTLYRTSDDSPIVKALVKAAERGKQVAVLVEVKARFDEANNIEWGRMMENAGIHVAYGLVGLKTHSKTALIIREEAGELRTYCHIGTGNYHPKTARLYTDLGLLTANPVLGRDLINLFHALTGYSVEQTYQKVLVAPHFMRSEFNRLIEQEMDHQQKHGNGRIIAKMNAFDDMNIIKKLYTASQAGVNIDLILRGHTRMRPGIPGYSDTVRIVSILGRFLEHDRIFYFHNNGEPLVYIGSADWRRRNLDDRVELITPVEEPSLKQHLIDLLHLALSDNRLAWDLDSEGHYVQRQPANGQAVRAFHDMLMQQAKQA